MASSTEDYLDSLLRQAMGIPDPEPEVKPVIEPDLSRNDVLDMASGLSGSESAILGNVYDNNASFTNGEIDTTTVPSGAAVLGPAAAPAEPAVEAALPENMPDPDAPVAVSEGITENLLPDVPEEIPGQPLEEQAAVSEDPMADIPAVEIPEGPVVVPDGSLDIIPENVMEDLSVDHISMLTEPAAEEPVAEAEPEPIAEEPAVEAEPEPVVEEPLAEPTAVEKPLTEAPAVEIPVVEDTVAVPEPVIVAEPEPEPVAEEPVAETEPEPEPVAEEPAAPGLSIDDLDPNDANKALDADMIASLFASANAEAETEPAAEEPEVEAEPEPEPVAEEPEEEAEPEPEPVAEEPAAEKTAEEEPAAEEPVAENDNPDLDQSDIEALLAGGDIDAALAAASAEEAAEEPAEEAAEDAGVEDTLEELEIPEEGESDQLMPDQEISELLSSLDGLGADNNEEDKDSAEGADESEAEDASEETSGEGEATLDGIDMFDTDLSAMLDDVTSSLESSPESGEGEGAADTDLNDLLGALDDGSGDLAGIGDLLEKDENSELVDENSEMAEALFASDSDEELFGIDNLIDEEEGGKKKKKKKKKGGLFGRKKKGNVETIGGDEETLIDPELLDIPEEESVQKKPGFFASLFARLFEEVEDDEPSSVQIDQSAVDIAQEGAAENEAILSEIEGEGAAEDKKGKKEKKKKEKKEKKKKGKGEETSEGEEGEGSEESSKKKKKKEKKEKKKKEQLPEIPGKKLPRKKVVAIALFCITLGLVITFLAFLYPYSQDMEKAKKFYSTGEYQKTYEYMRGHRLTSDDQELYDKTTTLLRIKRPYDSYVNYMKMGLRMEALNALVQGIQMSDKYAEEAARLKINDKYTKQSRMIYDELYNTFGVTVDKARSWIELEGTPEYTRALYDCLRGTSGESAPEEEQPNSYMEEDDTGTVINAEENDL